MLIDAVIWKLENTKVEEKVIGDYARLLHSKMIRVEFDMRVIDDRFHLVEKPQIKQFARLLLQSYLSADQSECKLKLAPLILCMKLG